MISVKINSMPEALKRLQERGPLILDSLTQKMNELMVRLQSKVQGEAIPKFFKTDVHLGASVRVEPAMLQGAVITGFVDAGGVSETKKITLKSGAEVDYAVVQEYGVPHGWTIEPFSKKALAFMLDGKQMIRKKVFHPPLDARPFMRSSLEGMSAEITEGLQSTFTETLNG
jgi:hypothetical protein